MMFKLTAERYRGFYNRCEIPITPLTLLTGENSTGKTSVLAALYSVTNPSFPNRLSMNEDPFNISNFNSISSSFRNSQQSDYFRLGCIIEYENKDRTVNRYEEVARFEESDGFPVAKCLDMTLFTTSVHADFSADGACTVILKDLSSILKPIITKFPTMIFNRYFFGYFPRLLQDIIFSSEHSTNRNKSVEQKKEYESWKNIVRIIEQSSMPDRFSYYSKTIAPIRTKPKSTYDQIIGGFRPEGDHIPFEIAKLIPLRKSQREAPSGQLDLVNLFGERAGLFKAVDVKYLGNSKSDPIQLRVRIGSKKRNLVDVGYGVSQALPVLIETTGSTSDKDSLFNVRSSNSLILQQPEVHLHPRAQAELGSLFVYLVSSNQKKLIVETHSDYIINRVRTSIAKGLIPKDLVTLLYFSTDNEVSNCSRVDIDEKGNIANAPADYRDFFLKEEEDSFLN